MTAQPLQAAGVTLVQNEQGVALKYGWLYSQQISIADAMRIRDWLDVAYPKQEPEPLSYAWLNENKISAFEATRVRDWLDTVYPVRACICGDSKCAQ